MINRLLLCLAGAVLPLCAESETITFKLKKVFAFALQQPSDTYVYDVKTQQSGSAFTVQLRYKAPGGIGGAATLTITPPAGPVTGVRAPDLHYFQFDTPAVFQFAMQYMPDPPPSPQTGGVFVTTDTGSSPVGSSNIAYCYPLGFSGRIPKVSGTCPMTRLGLGTSSTGDGTQVIQFGADASLAYVNSLGDPSGWFSASIYAEYSLDATCSGTSSATTSAARPRDAGCSPKSVAISDPVFPAAEETLWGKPVLAPDFRVPVDYSTIGDAEVSIRLVDAGGHPLNFRDRSAKVKGKGTATLTRSE